jgi:hypothetical protein
MIENASNVDITLPSIDTDDNGSWIMVFKLGAGDLSIDRNDADTIESDTSVSNTTTETWANIKLVVAKGNMWKLYSMLGSWSTSS